MQQAEAGHCARPGTLHSAAASTAQAAPRPAEAAPGAPCAASRAAVKNSTPSAASAVRAAASCQPCRPPVNTARAAGQCESAPGHAPRTGTVPTASRTATCSTASADDEQRDRGGEQRPHPGRRSRPGCG